MAWCSAQEFRSHEHAAGNKGRCIPHRHVVNSRSVNSFARVVYTMTPVHARCPVCGNPHRMDHAPGCNFEARFQEKRKVEQLAGDVKAIQSDYTRAVRLLRLLVAADDLTGDTDEFVDLATRIAKEARELLL